MTIHINKFTAVFNMAFSLYHAKKLKFLVCYANICIFSIFPELLNMKKFDSSKNIQKSIEGIYIQD